MALKAVTDPAILAALGETPVAAKVRKPVTDPAVLQQLGPAGSGRPTGFLSAFASGVKRAGYNEAANLKAALGVGASFLDADYGAEMVDEAIGTANRGAQQNPKGIEKVEDIGSVGDALTYTGDVLGEGLTKIGATVATGGIGGFVGKQVAKRAVKETTKKAILKRGFVAGALAEGISTETGATAQEQKEATGEVHPYISLGAGVGKGALDAILPRVLGSSIGLNADEGVGIARKLAKLMEGSKASRIAKAAGGAALVEGGTEAMQEAIDMFARDLTDKEYEFFNSEGGSRLLNAAVAGSLTGAPIAGTLSAVSGKVAPEEAIPEAELPQGEPGEPQKREAGLDLTQQINPLSEAIQKERTNLYQIGVTLHDLQRGETPGSKPEHVAVGFTPLPDGYRGIKATTMRELQDAPLELVARDLAAVRNDLAEASQKDIVDDPKVNQLAKRQLESINTSIGYLAGASFNKDSKGTPTAILTTGDNDPIATTPVELVSTNEDLLPSGFKLDFYHGPGQLQLQRMDGSPVFNFPNDVSYKTIITHVMKSDMKLQNSGFYKVATNNIKRLHVLQGSLDMTEMKTLTGRAKVDYYRKAMEEGSYLDDFKGKQKPKVGMGAAMMEAGRVKFNRFMQQGYTILQWKQANPELVPLTNYVDILQTEKGVSMKTISRGDAILKRFMRLGKEQQDAGYDYMDALVRQNYKSEAERQLSGTNTYRHPTPEEERHLIQGTKYRKNKTPLLRETYQAIQDMRAMQDDEFRSYIKDVSAELDYIVDPKTRLAQAKGLQSMVESYFAKPRFPFTSIGDFIVTVKDAEGKLIAARQSESPSDQKADYDELAAKHGDKKVQMSRIPVEQQKWTALPHMVIRDLARRGYLKGLKKEQIQVLEFLAQIGPENRKRFINGMNPKKRSIDLQRSFALWTQNVANANFARRAGPAMQKEIEALDYVRKNGADLNTNKLGLMISALNEHHAELLNPTPDWSGMKNFAFMWHIAFNAKSALMNATQVPLVAMPYLSKQFGDLKASAAIMKAYADKRSIMGKEKVSELSDSMSKLLTKGIESGIVDESFATELAGLAEGTNLNRMLAGSKYDRFTKEVSYYGSYLFAAVEKLNRSVVFRASAQLAMDNPNNTYLSDMARQQPLAMERLQREGFSETEAKAYLAGTDAIHRTMFEYAKWNRPKIIRGGLKGALGTFMMFTQGMLHFVAHSPGSGRYLLMMLATAGLMGLPGAEDLNDLITALSQRFFGKDFNPKVEARKLIRSSIDPFIKTHFNAGHKTASDLLLHGLSSDSFGLATAADALGVPYIPHINMANSLGMGRVLPISADLLKPGVDYNRALANTTERVSGAAFGPMFAIIEALRSDNADFKRWESAMPAAIRGFLRAGRYEQEGRERGFKGDTILDFDPIDPSHKAEIIATSLGFMPTRLSKKWDETIARRDATNYWDTRRAMLLSQLDYALMMKDPEGKSDAMAAIKRYNSQLPEEMRPKKITSKTVKTSMTERARRRKQPTAKGDKPAEVFYKKLYGGLPQ